MLNDTARAVVPGCNALWLPDKQPNGVDQNGVMYAIKTDITNPADTIWRFDNQKTMYGGKNIAAGDGVYVFASETQGGTGLIAKGIVLTAAPCPRTLGVPRQTPRVDVVIERAALAKRPLGRVALKAYTNWNDGQPQTSLNFMFYRQATNKIVAVSDAVARFLDSYF